MQHSTLKAALQESLWRQDQDRQARYIAAQEAARALALKVHAVSARYAFAPAHDLFRFTAQGVCTQAAMMLTDTDGHRLTVVAKTDDAGDELWFLTDVSALRFDAQVYIKAVQDRLEANKAQNNRRAN